MKFLPIKLPTPGGVGWAGWGGVGWGGVGWGGVGWGGVNFLLLLISAVHDISRTFDFLTLELSWMLLSFHILFNFVMAAVACAVLARISGFEPSSEIDPRYLKVDTVSSAWSLILMSFWMPFGLLVITLVLSAFISMPYFLEAVSKHSASASSSSSSPASPSMSSANRKLVMVLPPMLTVPWCFSRAPVIISSRNNVEQGRRQDTSQKHYALHSCLGDFKAVGSLYRIY